MDHENDKEARFNNAIRENIICLCFFIFFYLLASCFINVLWDKNDLEAGYFGNEDFYISRIIFIICAFSITTCLASSILLPFSIISNEILIIYPDNEYLNWLNSSLIYSVWNYIFLLSNCCLFILLPFAYFLLDSIGFSNFKKNFINRLYETLLTYSLFLIMFVGISWVLFVVFNDAPTHKGTLFSLWNYIYFYYIPISYHCISLLGAITLLICIPLGFSKTFDVFGQSLIMPRLVRNLDEEKNINRQEYLYYQQKYLRINQIVVFQSKPDNPIISDLVSIPKPIRKRISYRIKSNAPNVCNGVGVNDYNNLDKMIPSVQNGTSKNDIIHREGVTLNSSQILRYKRCRYVNYILGNASFENDSTCMLSNNDNHISKIESKLKEIKNSLAVIQALENAPFWKRNILNYPFAMLLLFILTALCILKAGIHCLELVLTENALPSYSKHLEFGKKSLSFLGPSGVCLEIILILYLKTSSIIGFMHLPLFTKLKPKLHNTSIGKLIVNCVIALIFTSAYPVFSRTLGITQFDLIGHFGQLQWLSSFHMVILYNLTFIFAAIWCLTNKFTHRIIEEIVTRLFPLSWQNYILKRHQRAQNLTPL